MRLTEWNNCMNNILFWFLTNTAVWIMVLHWMKTLFSKPALKSWANRQMLSNAYKQEGCLKKGMCVGVRPAQEAWQILTCDQEGACRAAGGCVPPDLCKDHAVSSPHLSHAVGLYLFWFIYMTSLQLNPSCSLTKREEWKSFPSGEILYVLLLKYRLKHSEVF